MLGYTASKTKSWTDGRHDDYLESAVWGRRSSLLSEEQDPGMNLHDPPFDPFDKASSLVPLAELDIICYRTDDHAAVQEL